MGQPAERTFAIIQEKLFHNNRKPGPVRIVTTDGDMPSLAAGESIEPLRTNELRHKRHQPPLNWVWGPMC